MKCPFCSSDSTRVIDSRPADDNNSIRRRRLCDDCGKRFTTYEKVETIPLIVIKKDNNREQYDRSKIEAGVLRACHKRPISINQINQLVDEVETEIFNLEEKEIPSSLIGELVTFPVILNRFGILLAEAESQVAETKLNMDVYEAKTKERLRIELAEQNNGKAPTVEALNNAVVSNKAYQAMKRKYIEVVKTRDYINSIFWAVKDKSEKLNKLSLSIQP